MVRGSKKRPLLTGKETLPYSRMVNQVIFWAEFCLRLSIYQKT
jgi:hypothetical protein